MKRRYPPHFFILGLITNFIRYSLLLLLGIAVLLIGVLFSISNIKIIGALIICAYIAISIGIQIRIRQASLEESDSPEINEMMDVFYGVYEDDDPATRQERIENFLKQKIEEHKYDTINPDNEEENTDEEDSTEKNDDEEN